MTYKITSSKLRIEVASGGEKWLEWAQMRLRAMQKLREQWGLPKIAKTFELPGNQVHIVSSRFYDLIRIAGGPAIFMRISTAEYATFDWQLNLQERISSAEFPNGTTEDPEDFVSFSHGASVCDAAIGGTGIMIPGPIPSTNGSYYLVDLASFAVTGIVPWIDIESIPGEGGGPPSGVRASWERNAASEFLFASREVSKTSWPIGYATKALVPTYGTEVTVALPGTNSGPTGVQGYWMRSATGLYEHYDVITGARTHSSGWGTGAPASAGAAQANSKLIFRPVSSARIEVSVPSPDLSTAPVIVTTFDVYDDSVVGSAFRGLACDDDNLLVVYVSPSDSAIHAFHYAISQDPDTEEWSFAPTEVSANLGLVTTGANLLAPAQGGFALAINPKLDASFKHGA